LALAENGKGIVAGRGDRCPSVTAHARGALHESVLGNRVAEEIRIAGGIGEIDHHAFEAILGVGFEVGPRIARFLVQGQQRSGLLFRRVSLPHLAGVGLGKNGCLAETIATADEIAAARVAPLLECGPGPIG
jgi:hypothetical protein